MLWFNQTTFRGTFSEAPWAALESCVEETATLILMNDRTARMRMCEQTRRPSGNPDEASCRALIKLWEQKQPRVTSVGHRFERLLGFFGLGAPLDEAHAAQLAEINALRNCLMHRRGIVDEKAVREAPSLAPRLNQPIAISRADFLAYHKVVGDYAVLLMGRVTVSNYCT